jgi:DNA-binding GntR family transcriptional regulator
MVEMQEEGSGLVIPSASDLVYEAIRSRIIGGLEPGTVLRLVPLSNEFGVSTMPVREALNRLQYEGLVEGQSRRGAVVAAMRLSDLVDIQILRGSLISVGLRLGIPNLTASDDVEIQAALKGVLSSVETSDGEKRLEAHLTHSRRMSAIVFRAAGHARVNELIETHEHAAYRYVRVALKSLGALEADSAADVAFADATSARDVVEAERILRGQLLWTVDCVKHLFPDEVIPEQRMRVLRDESE